MKSKIPSAFWNNQLGKLTLIKAMSHLSDSEIISTFIKPTYKYGRIAALSELFTRNSKSAIAFISKYLLLSKYSSTHPELDFSRLKVLPEVIYSSKNYTYLIGLYLHNCIPEVDIKFIKQYSEKFSATLSEKITPFSFLCTIVSQNQFKEAEKHRLLSLLSMIQNEFKSLRLIKNLDCVDGLDRCELLEITFDLTLTKHKVLSKLEIIQTFEIGFKFLCFDPAHQYLREMYTTLFYNCLLLSNLKAQPETAGDLTKNFTFFDLTERTERGIDLFNNLSMLTKNNLAFLIPSFNEAEKNTFFDIFLSRNSCDINNFYTGSTLILFASHFPNFRNSAMLVAEKLYKVLTVNVTHFETSTIYQLISLFLKVFVNTNIDRNMSIQLMRSMLSKDSSLPFENFHETFIVIITKALQGKNQLIESSQRHEAFKRLDNQQTMQKLKIQFKQYLLWLEVGLAKEKPLCDKHLEADKLTIPANQEDDIIAQKLHKQFVEIETKPFTVSPNDLITLIAKLPINDCALYLNYICLSLSMFLSHDQLVEKTNKHTRLDKQDAHTHDMNKLSAFAVRLKLQPAFSGSSKILIENMSSLIGEDLANHILRSYHTFKQSDYRHIDTALIILGMASFEGFQKNSYIKDLILALNITNTVRGKNSDILRKACEADFTFMMTMLIKPEVKKIYNFSKVYHLLSSSAKISINLLVIKALQKGDIRYLYLLETGLAHCSNESIGEILGFIDKNPDNYSDMKVLLPKLFKLVYDQESESLLTSIFSAHRDSIYNETNLPLVWSQGRGNPYFENAFCKAFDFNLEENTLANTNVIT